MSKQKARAEQHKLATLRAKEMTFGDQVTNVAASDINPGRYAFFVRTAGNQDVELTDKKGKFWRVGKEVVFKGWLGEEEAKKLFQPIWEADFGKSKKEGEE